MLSNRYIRLAAAAAALALGGSLLSGCGAAQKEVQAPPLTVLTQPEYPQMPLYPFGEDGKPVSEEAMEAWQTAQLAQRREPGYADSLQPFWDSSRQAFLSGSENENRVCSPVNIAMALSMLTELTAGDTQQELLTALNAEDLNALRSQANALWNAQYLDDGATRLTLANSLWINGSLPLHQEPLDTLSRQYYAASYAGIPGSPEMDQALRDWLNTQTGGLLQSQADSVHLDSQTVLSLCSALHYQAQWADVFSEKDTTPGDFFTPSGNVTVDFLRKDLTSAYFWGEHFGAVALAMENGGGTMWLILPDEGTSPEQLLSDPQLSRFLENPRDWPDQKSIRIHLGLPKFDVSAQLDLTEGLKALGISRVFGDQADFSPLLDSGSLPVRLSQCDHNIRVAVDEKGITAAAFTQLAMAGACLPPEEELDFLLNRPFLFELQSMDGLPLITGIVSDPAA